MLQFLPGGSVAASPSASTSAPPPPPHMLHHGGGGGGGVPAPTGGLLEEELRGVMGGVVAALDGPQLALVRQTSSTVERISRNGLQKHVHVVVKQCPFALHIALVQPPRPPAPSVADSTPSLNFKWLALDASLVYDSEALKPVSFVKTKPIEFKPVVNESGDQVTLNMKIKVLTSQHEDMFFRVRVVALQQKTRQPLNPPLELVSEPIKVISKPKQSKKKQCSKKRSLNDLLIEAVHRIESQQRRQHRVIDHLVKRRRTTTDPSALGDSSSPEPPLPSSLPGPSFPSPFSTSPSLSTSSPALTFPGGPFSAPLPFYQQQQQEPYPLTSHSPVPARRSMQSEEIQAMIDGSDEKERARQASLGRVTLMDTDAAQNHPPYLAHQDNLHSSSTTTTTTSSAPSHPPDELEQGVEQFLLSYSRLPPEERAARIRRFMRRASTQDSEQLGSFFTCAITALNPLKQVKREPSDASSPGCSCVVCPHQQELARIDQFYKDFLAIDFPLFGPS